MRTVSHHPIAVCALALLVASALAGCATEPTPAPTHTAAATDAPVFASDEEALAAATKAYAAYLKASDAISNDGGTDPERIAPFIAPSLLKSELEGFAGYRSAGAHSVGSTTFVVSSVQGIEASKDFGTSISLYICEDVSDLDVVDSKGVSLVSPSRTPLTPFEVTFEGSADSIVLGYREVWEGRNFC